MADSGPKLVRVHHRSFLHNILDERTRANGNWNDAKYSPFRLPSVSCSHLFEPGNTKGGSITVPLTSLFASFGISCMTTDNFCFYFQNRLIRTNQTGGQWYSDTSPFSIPCLSFQNLLRLLLRSIKSAGRLLQVSWATAMQLTVAPRSIQWFRGCNTKHAKPT